MKKAKSFIEIIFVFLICFILLYVGLCFYIFSPKSSENHSYKHYLITSKSNIHKIIIESGSNSLYALDSNLLEKEFKLLTINLSDNASYPLEHKLARIEKYARKNDIVIMPLEYGHYSYESPSREYLKNIPIKLNFYFQSINFFQKIKIISQIPIQDLLLAYRTQKNEVKKNEEFENRFQNNQRGDGVINKEEKLEKGLEKVACDEYILGTVLKSDFKISEIFKKNVDYMQKISKEKNVKFILTYPAVVGDDCLRGENGARTRAFMAEVKEYLKSKNIAFIGKFKDSIFKSSMVYDTYYHINEEARQIRTQKLIKDLKENNIL